MPLHIGGLKSKYFSRHTKVDGIRFDSMAEARRYSELKLLVKAGQITDFERQPLYDLFVPGHGTGEPVKIGYYRADFRYKVGDTVVVEDLKSPPTKTSYYRLKKRMVEATYGFQITEVS